MSKDSFFDDYFNIPDENNEDDEYEEYKEITEEEWRKLCEEQGLDPDTTDYIDLEYDDYIDDDDEEWDEDDLEDDDEDGDEYSDIDPEEYTEDMIAAMNEVIRVESGVDEPGIKFDISVMLPMLITPVNKYLRFIKYPYDKSLIAELLSQGWSLENAISYTCRERIQDYVNDYVLKDDDDNLVYEEELVNLDIEDEMFPNVNEPYWIINI